MKSVTLPKRLFGVALCVCVRSSMKERESERDRDRESARARELVVVCGRGSWETRTFAGDKQWEVFCP